MKITEKITLRRKINAQLDAFETEVAGFEAEFGFRPQSTNIVMKDGEYYFDALFAVPFMVPAIMAIDEYDGSLDNFLSTTLSLLSIIAIGVITAAFMFRAQRKGKICIAYSAKGRSLFDAQLTRARQEMAKHREFVHTEFASAVERMARLSSFQDSLFRLRLSERGFELQSPGEFYPLIEATLDFDADEIAKAYFDVLLDNAIAFSEAHFKYEAYLKTKPTSR